MQFVNQIKIKKMKKLLKGINESIIKTYDTKNGNRSNGRLKILHSSIVEEFLENEKYYVKYEHKYKDINNKFSIDISLFDKETDKLKVILLIKAPLQSIKKNKYNYSNTNYGEVIRIICSPEFDRDIKIIFINILPSKTYTKHTKKNKYVLENYKKDTKECTRSL